MNLAKQLHLFYPTAPVEGAVGGSSEEPRNSNLVLGVRGKTFLFFEEDIAISLSFPGSWTNVELI